MPQLRTFTHNHPFLHFRPEVTVPGITGNVLLAAEPSFHVGQDLGVSTLSMGAWLLGLIKEGNLYSLQINKAEARHP